MKKKKMITQYPIPMSNENECENKPDIKTCKEWLLSGLVWLWVISIYFIEVLQVQFQVTGIAVMSWRLMSNPVIGWWEW